MADSPDNTSASSESETLSAPKVERSWRPDSTASPVFPPATDGEPASEAVTDAPIHDLGEGADLGSGDRPDIPPSPEQQTDADGSNSGASGGESPPRPSSKEERTESMTGEDGQGATAETSPAAGGSEGSPDAPMSTDSEDLARAREKAKRISDETFDDATDDPEETGQTAQSSSYPPDPAPRADADFVTDETRHRSPADRVEEAIQEAAYRQNEGSAKSDWTPQERRDHRIATTFALLVSKVAEDMSYQRRPGDEFWDPRKIMRRQIDHRPLRHCKMEYTKRRLALLVDTSPSCRDEAVFYSKIASGALLRDDIDIFLCPNGRIEAKFDPEPMRFVADERGEDWALEGRTVLYFTDWDGSAQLVRHARNCTLYWFDNCPPEQYWDSRRERHQRVRLRYRGRHFHCPDPNTFRRLVRKIRP